MSSGEQNHLWCYLQVNFLHKIGLGVALICLSSGLYVLNENGNICLWEGFLFAVGDMLIASYNVV